MNENEAKRFLKIEKECINRSCDRNCAQCDIVQRVEDLNSAYDTAIKALEEEQKYYAIGTPEECRAAMEKQNHHGITNLGMSLQIKSQKQGGIIVGLNVLQSTCRKKRRVSGLELRMCVRSGCRRLLLPGFAMRDFLPRRFMQEIWRLR